MTWRPMGRFPDVRPQGSDNAGNPARLTLMVKMSLKYMVSGSSVRSPNLNAGVGEVGVRRHAKSFGVQTTGREVDCTERNDSDTFLRRSVELALKKPQSIFQILIYSFCEKNLSRFEKISRNILVNNF